MAVLIAQPARIPVVDPQTGLITREWQRYFTGLYSRVGGANGLGTMDVDAGSYAAMQQAPQEASFSDVLQAQSVFSSLPPETSQADDIQFGQCDIMQQE
jgi:hypothetical protein